MLKKSTSVVVFLYGVCLIILGLIGYYKGHSLISLWAGSGFGALIVIASALMFYGQKIGGFFAVILTVLLTAMFAYRYTMIGKPIPGILAVLSGLMLLFLLAQTAKWKKG